MSTVTVSNNPEFWGPDANARDAWHCANALAAMLENAFPGVVARAGATRGPSVQVDDDQIADEIAEWAEDHWIEAISKALNGPGSNPR